MIFHDFPLKNQLFDEHFLVINQWIPFWILMDLLENCRLHQAVTFCLFGVRSQPRYLKVSTPRAWSIARVKSRVARFYARIFLCCSERNFWIFSSGDVHRPTLWSSSLISVNNGRQHGQPSKFLNVPQNQSSERCLLSEHCYHVLDCHPQGIFSRKCYLRELNPLAGIWTTGGIAAFGHLLPSPAMRNGIFNLKYVQMDPGIIV